MVVMAPIKKPKQTVVQQEEGEYDAENVGMDEDDNVPQEVQVIAEELKIVKSLACNDLTKRNKQMKKLRKWLQLRAQSSFSFCQEDFMRIWKGLYYNMWYSDKPLVQEELAEQLGKLLECFEGNLQYSVDFFGAFLKTMCIEWFGIDQWRIDKFLMLVRRMLRYMFKLLKASEWSMEAIEIFNKHATETVLFENVSAKGLTMHYFDIFFEELAKISEGEISAEKVSIFIKPFVKFMATQRDFNLISHCRTRVFYHLLYQSTLGREYSEKYNAWKEMGFPTKHINDLEKVEESENEEMEEENKSVQQHLDPRAGNVDVFMPELSLDGQAIITELEHFLYKEECTTKRRKLLKKLLEIFKTYHNGEFPLGVKTMPRFEGKNEKPLIKDKIKQLENLENELYGVDRKLKQMTKRKRRKFLKSLNFDEIDESNYDQTLEKALPKDYLVKRRKICKNSLMTGWLEEELSEGDLNPKIAENENQMTKDSKIPSSKSKNNKIKCQKSTNENLLQPGKKIKKMDKLDGKVSCIKLKKIEKNEDLEENDKNKTQDTTAKLTNSEEHTTTILRPKEPKVLKISDPEEQNTPKLKKKITDEWDEPLAEGEVEYFLPSRKLQLKKANSELVLNPLSKQLAANSHSTPINKKISKANTSKTSSSSKRVKIALKHNTSQNPHEYIQQIKSSPDIPYDAKKKPVKGLLKPNAMPSPIDPFYKKKIGLKLLNDTF